MIKAKKSLGQNFLVDPNIIDKIANIVNIENKSILEVGPGTGNLTSALLKKKPKKFYVIEKDNNLSTLLEKKFKNSLSIINDDILNLAIELVRSGSSKEEIKNKTGLNDSEIETIYAYHKNVKN